MDGRPGQVLSIRSALAAALALALATAWAAPSAADPGGVRGQVEGEHGGPPLPLGLAGTPAASSGGPGADHAGPPAALSAPVGVSSEGPVAPVIAPPAPRARGLGLGRDGGLGNVGLGGQDGGGGVSGALDHLRGAARETDHAVGREARGRGEAADVEAVDLPGSEGWEVAELTKARARAARALIVDHRNLIEPDNLGRPVVRGEVLALAPTPAALARAERAGFRIRSRDALPALGLESVVLRAPPRMTAVMALRRLRALDPRGQYDFNHVYQESGAVGRRGAPAPAAPTTGTALRPPPHAIRIGLVDGGVAANAPALAQAHVIQRGFAAGGPRPSAHGTAVASLIAGREGIFRGAAPGAWLFVADVYGATPAGGSAEAIVRALAWLAQSDVPVINISLVGPPNLLLGAAIKNLVAGGRIVVAAVGNDGPAAPPLYPAAYPGVVAVTGVDPRWRILPEASRSPHVDFAAPGSDMAAAGMAGGFVSVRGTSFAAPIASGLLAGLIRRPGSSEARRAVSVLGRRALDVGPPGRDSLYGHGVVGSELRVPPGEVHARMALLGP